MQKTTLVTGAGSGIGRALCRELAGRGHIVYAVSRNKERLESLVNECGNRLVHAVPADISTEAGVAKVEAAVRARSSRLDVLVNCAGKLVRKPFAETGWEDWAEVYRTNVFGPAMLIRVMESLMRRESGHAHVVNVSSMGGVQGSVKFAGLSAYSSSKAALCGLTECLAEEFRGAGVRVNALAIGSVGTEMFGEAFPGAEAATTPERMAVFMADFALSGEELFNGKLVQVSSSTP
jgi:NAD(P)-dependent dehydrogenase (short-subunit alcohol dehydrogenase family)